MDEAGKIVEEVRVENANLDDLAQRYAGEQAALEATSNYYHIHDTLSEHLDVTVAHPKELNQISDTDKKPGPLVERVAGARRNSPGRVHSARRRHRGADPECETGCGRRYCGLLWRPTRPHHRTASRCAVRTERPLRTDRQRFRVRGRPHQDPARPAHQSKQKSQIEFRICWVSRTGVIDLGTI